MKKIVEAIKYLIEALALLRILSERIKEARREGWLQEGRELAARLERAKTDEERQKMAESRNKHYDAMPD